MGCGLHGCSDYQVIPVQGHAHTMEAAPGPGQFRGRHQDQGVLHFIGIDGPALHPVDELFCVDDGETVFPEGFHGLVVPVIPQDHSFLQGKEVAGIGPLFPGVEREFVVAGINEFYLVGTFQVVFADVRKQIFEVVEILGVIRGFFPELDDL